MEPITLTTVATAIAAIFFTKVLEVTAENVGDVLWDKRQDLVAKLQGRSEKFAGLLQGTQTQPLDYGEAILEIKGLADRDPELAKTIKEVEVEAEKVSDPQFQEKLQEVRGEANKIESSQPTIQNLSKLAETIEKIGVANYGVINNPTINF